MKSSNLNGEDSLLSIVQMPRGVPVATVAIGMWLSLESNTYIHACMHIGTHCKYINMYINRCLHSRGQMHRIYEQLRSPDLNQCIIYSVCTCVLIYNIGNATNAGLLAVRILGCCDSRSQLVTISFISLCVYTNHSQTLNACMFIVYLHSFLFNNPNAYYAYT